MKQIIWLPHASERQKERNIGKIFISTALFKPDQILKQGRRKIIHKRYFDRNEKKEFLLRIFIEETINQIVIYSVYRTSKINKYWRNEP